MKSKARITAIGTYVPPKKLLNEDLEKMVDTNDEWIVQRTGIKERRIVGNEEYASKALNLGIEEGKVQYGDTLLLYGFGGGLTHLGLILKWNIR
ncbi:3-oxoacyl-[acyl-carrier-protein] synthase III C-terminal domain-containing protein [Neobacillus fumarioli]|uniref:3-oxoacyl-[acyl-carrier-protein] synthase III C-terminal domain-containing protein n=1 Tax=Neobacillus fumarioli TaxID=105229 RepID=UPI0009FBBA22|nr:3-oxoacyl-[acyl-carrier-protein] synthase III C-terminal domain-containing protein [Neobacillus fumarioli]